MNGMGLGRMPREIARELQGLNTGPFMGRALGLLAALAVVSQLSGPAQDSMQVLNAAAGAENPPTAQIPTAAPQRPRTSPTLRPQGPAPTV